MLPWLMGLGRGAAQFGKSFRHPFRRKVPGTEGVFGAGTRPVPGTAGLRPPRQVSGEGLRTGYRGDIGTRPAGPLNPQAHKVRFGAAVGAGGLAAYPFLRGEQEQPAAPFRPATPVQALSAPSDMMSFAESEIARVEKGEQDFRKLLDFGMLIAATGGDASKFFERGKWILEQSDQYAQDKQYAKAVRAVYKKGDMPKSAREAYERLTPLMGPERAAVLSGHQLGMEPGKTKEERAYRRIEEMALQGDLEGAAAQLVAAWNSGLLKNPATHITQWEAQMDRARDVLKGITGGGAGYPEGVTSIRPGLAASA
jgi:hypothetical protein